MSIADDDAVPLTELAHDLMRAVWGVD